MELNNLQPVKGSVKNRKRVGRGEGSGRGGTATRGHKGAKSRSGYKRKRGFEGGQMPIQRVVPKYGFTNPNRQEYDVVNLGLLQEISERKKITKIALQDLIDAGVVSNKAKVKILGDGELTIALEVSVHAFSKSAKEAIEKQNGKAITI